MGKLFLNEFKQKLNKKQTKSSISAYRKLKLILKILQTEEIKYLYHIYLNI